MSKKQELVLQKVLEEVLPTKQETEFMQGKLSNFVSKITGRIKKLDIKAELFIGGSFAKNTVVKKDVYDVDMFLRFDSKHEEKDLTKLTKRILFWTRKVSRVHGSRDYFRVKVTPNFFFEIIPVRKIKNPKEAENITDLSYSHVNYINKKVKSKKLLNDMALAKAFCHATKTYGAESYVNGFSGYALELLIYHYGGFQKMLKELSKEHKQKRIIDIEKLYKKKQDIMMDLNGAKLSSPIILIDPTFKQRNATAALSDETFEKFQKAARSFLKNPSQGMFKIKPTNLEKIKEEAIKDKNEFILIKTKTKKQAGDIAGTKLLKFHKHLNYELEKFFEIKETGFNYSLEENGNSYFVLKKRKEIIFNGPETYDDKNIELFKKEHEKVFEKEGRFYAKEKFDLSAKEFLEKWSKKNKKKIREMYISKFKFFD